MTANLRSAGDRSSWERGFDRVLAYGPYVTLAIGGGLALVAPEASSRLLTLGLMVVSLAWVYVMFTRAGARLESQAWVRVYFAGVIALSTVLMAHNPSFFVFPITGFLHAYLLKPAPVSFLGVLATSLVINSMIVVPDPTPDGLWTYGIVVVIQTLAIGFGIAGGEKIGELSEARRRAVRDLETALLENKGLHAQLVAQAREAGVSDERRRMGREIHDTIAQGLTGVITQLEAAGHAIDDRSALEQHLGKAERIARDSLEEARRAVRGAVPLPLEERALSDAIGDVVDRWASDGDVVVDWSVVGDPVPLHPEIEVTLLRVVQESLTNVARHASAHRVGVTLSYIGEVVTVDVRDDGVGFSPNGTAGFGLRGMKARVEGLAGVLEIETRPGSGTAISATLPGVPDG